jgi:hypothetical protein
MRKNTITIILTEGDFMQTATRVEEPMPNTAKLTATEWRVIVTTGEYTRFGKSCAEIKFKPGALGYARRNGFQTDYIQIVCHTAKGNVNCWYVHELEAENLISVARAAPNQDSPQRAWKTGWAQSF